MQSQCQFYVIQLSKRVWWVVCSVSRKPVIVDVCCELNFGDHNGHNQLLPDRRNSTQCNSWHAFWLSGSLFRRTKSAMLSLNLRRVLPATKRNMQGWSVRPRPSRPTLPQLKLRWEWSPTESNLVIREGDRQMMKHNLMISEIKTLWLEK